MASSGFIKINQIDIKKRDFTLKLKIIRKWITAVGRYTNMQSSIELILMDEDGTLIQALVERRLFSRYENIFVDGLIVSIQKPTVLLNTTKYKLVENEHKLMISYQTRVAILSGWCGPQYSFRFQSFNAIKSSSITEDLTFDVIGRIKRWFKFEKNSNDSGVVKARLTMELIDFENERLNVTLWDGYALQMKEFVNRRNYEEYIVVIIQFARKKVFKDSVFVQNVYGNDVTHLFINSNIEEFAEYMERLISMEQQVPGSVPPPFGLYVFQSVEDEFLSSIPFTPIGSICDIKHPKLLIIVGTIKEVFEGLDWYYLGCDKCGRKLWKKEIVRENEHGDSFIEDMLECRNSMCEGHIITPVPKFRIEIGVEDVSGNVLLTLFDSHVSKLLNKTAADLVQQNLVEGGKTKFPDEAKVLLEQTFAFKIEVSQYNFDKDNQNYTILKLIQDVDIISQLQRRLEVEQNNQSESRCISFNAFDSDDTRLKDYDNDVDDNVTPHSKICDRTLSIENSSGSNSKESDTKRKLDKVYEEDEDSQFSATKVATVNPKPSMQSNVEVVVVNPKVEKKFG